MRSREFAFTTVEPQPRKPLPELWLLIELQSNRVVKIDVTITWSRSGTPGHTMSTPTSASKKPAGHATTPSYLGLSSPAPRSIASPTATRRDQAGKTPTAHGAAGAGSSKIPGAGGTPMVRNLSQQGASSSPGLAGISFGTPLAGLGLDLAGTPGQLNMSTPLGGGPLSGGAGAMGAAMLPSLSGLSGLDMPLGGHGQHIKRNEDEERRAKMRRVLKTIGRARARVSEESVARCARRLGLQTDIDQEKLTAEEKERRVGNRSFAIAGKMMVVEVELKDHIAQNVTVMFGESPVLEESGVAVGDILLKDLAVRDGVLLQTPLDSFTRHLSGLARMDRLSEKVNCFEAIHGLYTSLRRLYDVELKAAQEALAEQESASKRRRPINEMAEKHVICSRGGRPTMHERGQIGMSIDYWTPGFSASAAKADETAMDIDESSKNDDQQPLFDHVHSLRVDVETSLADLYPSLRISDGWLPESFDLPSSDALDGLPWQEPPPTYVGANAGAQSGDAMNLDGSQKLPDLRFIARFDPPVVVPYSVAATIMTAMGTTQPAPYHISAYQYLILDIPTPNGLAPDISATQAVLTVQGGEEIDLKHRYSLDVPKPEIAFKLEEVPFSHPRQLIELLPTLRQWACFGNLLRGAFERPATRSSDHDDLTGTEALVMPMNGVADTNGHANGPDISRISLSDILSGGKQNGSHPSAVDKHAQPVEVVMQTSPSPTLCLTLADKQSNTTWSADVQIGLNAHVVASLGGQSTQEHEMDADGNLTDASGIEARAARAAKALSICGDLGVWLEWLRKERSG